MCIRDRAYSFRLLALVILTSDQVLLSRRSADPTPNGETPNICALITLFSPYVTQQTFLLTSGKWGGIKCKKAAAWGIFSPRSFRGEISRSGCVDIPFFRRLRFAPILDKSQLGTPFRGGVLSRVLCGARFRWSPMSMGLCSLPWLMFLKIRLLGEVCRNTRLA